MTLLLAQISGGSGVAYTLSGATGSYTYTGNNATLVPKHNYALSGATGSYAYTGQNATFVVAHRLSGSAGSYTYTGQSATLTYTAGASSTAYSLSGATGAYSYTGNNAVLDYHSNAITEVVSRGGFKAKSNVKKNERPDVEKAINEAIDKVIGKPITPIVKEIDRIKPNVVTKTNFTDQINEIILQTKIDILSHQINQINIDAELENDDEEAILLLLG